MRRFSLLLALLPLAACADVPPTDLQADAVVTLLNGAVGSGQGGVTLWLDGVAVGAASDTEPVIIPVGAGTHSVEVRKTVNGGPGVTRTLAIAAGDNHLVVAVAPLAGGIEPLIYGDSNTVVPAGATKLRVIHAAALAPAITVRRTQPDFDSLISVMFPFAYQAASPYLQSTPGTWTVVISHEDQADTLAMTGPIAIPAGESRTVVIVDDGLGGVLARVLVP